MVDIGQKTIHNKALCEDIFGHHTFVILYLRIALHFILMMILVWYFHWRRGRPTRTSLTREPLVRKNAAHLRSGIERSWGCSQITSHVIVNQLVQQAGHALKPHLWSTSSSSCSSLLFYGYGFAYAEDLGWRKLSKLQTIKAKNKRQTGKITLILDNSTSRTMIENGTPLKHGKDRFWTLGKHPLFHPDPLLNS